MTTEMKINTEMMTKKMIMIMKIVMTTEMTMITKMTMTMQGKKETPVKKTAAAAAATPTKVRHHDSFCPMSLTIFLTIFLMM